MKRTATLLAAIVAILTATAATVRTATETFVTNRIHVAEQGLAVKISAAAVAATNYTDSAIKAAGGVTPEMVTNIVIDVSPAPGNYAAVSNAALFASNRTASVEANLTNSVCNIVTNTVIEETAWAIDAEHYTAGFRIGSITYFEPTERWSLVFLVVDEQGQTISGGESEIEGPPDATALYFSGPGLSLTRQRIAHNALGLARNEDLANATNGLARASDLAAVRSVAAAATATNAAQTAALESVPGAVTNIVRDLSLGGIWDEALQVWWTPRMRNGSLTYEATTNVNLNAEN